MYEIKEFPLFTKWGTRLVTYQREGTNDAGALISILVQDEYKLLQHDLKPGMITIDLGAHIGAASLALASLGCTVHAVEVIPENFQLLRSNLSMNKFDQSVYCYPFPIMGTHKETEVFYTGTKTSTGQIHHFIGSTIHHSRLNSFCEAGNTITRTSITLEDLLSNIEYCHFLKIDIEGSEWDVFEQVNPSILDKIGIIVGELHRLDNRTIVHKEDLLPFLHGKFIDVTDQFEKEYNKPGDVTHFVYFNKLKRF
jgi:FkbM family methyltransferase